MDTKGVAGPVRLPAIGACRLVLPAGCVAVPDQGGDLRFYCLHRGRRQGRLSRTGNAGAQLGYRLLDLALDLCRGLWREAIDLAQYLGCLAHRARSQRPVVLLTQLAHLVVEFRIFQRCVERIAASHQLVSAGQMVQASRRRPAAG
jgi:hypothetical protein